MGSEDKEKRSGNSASLHFLFVLLGILSVILVIAIIGQEYYFRHSYKKGELAELNAQNPDSGHHFMTEKSGSDQTGGSGAQAAGESAGEEQTEAADAEDGAEDGAQQSAAGSGETSGRSGGDAAEGGPIHLESNESVSLKKQLMGIMPGIGEPGRTAEQVLAEADLMAAMYDYEGAAALIRSCDGYAEDTEMQQKVASYMELEDTLVEYPADRVPHVFFHSLIKDAEKAFDGDQYEDGYNQYMVTIREFNSIIEQMYEGGWVLVSLEDVAAATSDDGRSGFKAGHIMLPKGKKPFVLSQDDVCYYHYMDGDGFASKLIVDEEGLIRNEYIEDDGSVSVGDYDMVPLIDRFIEEHPDFSYHGAKGYIALTGYDGILGYRTDICYKTRQDLDSYQEEFFQKHPDFTAETWEQECEDAKRVAQAIIDDGWVFTSHTWGHQGMGEDRTTWEQFVSDVDKWDERVAPLIGGTNVLIYAFGGDIAGTEEYTGRRFAYLKEKGFDYFCGVDSAVYWVQIRDNYVRQMRRNIDGYRMYYNPEMLEDLFDVSKAWDPARPDSVPPI